MSEEKIKSFSVPITKAFLAKYYKDQFPPLLDEDARPKLVTSLSRFLAGMVVEHPLLANSIEGLVDFVTNNLNREPPHKIDENFFASREALKYIETIPVKYLNDPETNPVRQEISKIALEIFTNIEKYQLSSRERVEKTIHDMLPKDFRTTAIGKLRSIKENSAKAEVDQLVASGASFSEIYQLLWKQQLARRESLADIANATGLYKAIIMLISGIPEAVLEFMRSMNHNDGPLEAVRAKFGPFLYSQTKVLISISAFFQLEDMIHAYYSTQESHTKEYTNWMAAFNSKTNSIVLPLIKICQGEIGEYLGVMTKLFESFPLLIDVEDAYKASGVHLQDVSAAFGDDNKLKVQSVSARSSVALRFKFDGSLMKRNAIGFYFSCSPDVIISVSSTSSSNEDSPSSTSTTTTTTTSDSKPKTELLIPPRKIHGVFQGRIDLVPGVKTNIDVKLDNGYSYFTSKSVKIGFIELPSSLEEVTETKVTEETVTEESTSTTSEE